MATFRCFLSLFVIVFTTILSWTVVIMIDFYSGHGKNLTPHKLSEKPPFPNGKMENLFWVVQISDIHISKFRDPSRQGDLKVFCGEYVDIIKPVAVLVTGDIVDAKDNLQIGSRQYVEEWQIYQKVLQDSGVAKKTQWLDVRGNHDNFDVPSLNSELNMFRKYSMSASHAERRDSRSYQVVYETKFGKYSLNGVDPGLDPGPKRPFNFFGKFSEDDLESLEKLVENSRNHNLSIWFGHYPLSTVSGHFSYGRNLLRYGDVYLCGHLHTLGDLVTQMHAVHRDGHLELELGDWKVNRRYRILAVDHDLISFSDVSFGKWPVVVITNPKDAHYAIKAHEPLNRIRKSTHIRLLVFSSHDITSVQVSIDDVPLSSKVEHVEGPLYVCIWQPELYTTGLHRITVIAKDASGNSVESTSTFSIDGSRPALRLVPAMILLTDGQTLGRVLYFVSFLFIVCGPAIVKYFLLERTAVLRALSIPNGLKELTKTNSIFYPLFLFGLYTGIGPWFVAELTTGHVGVVFLHGLYLKGKWIPEPTVYAYGLFQNLLFQLPLTAYLASYLSQKQPATTSFSNGALKSHRDVKDGHEWGRCWQMYMNFILFITFLLQLYTSLSFWRAYGFMAFVFSPVKTWSLLLLVFLVKNVRYIVYFSRHSNRE